MKKFDIKDFLDPDEEIIYEGKNKTTGNILGIFLVISVLLLIPRHLTKLFFYFLLFSIFFLLFSLFHFYYNKTYLTTKGLYIIKFFKHKKILFDEILKVQVKNKTTPHGIDYSDLIIKTKNSKITIITGLSSQTTEFILRFIENKICKGDK